ncbi:hypothetical protein [Lysinibacillus sp. G4S2]|nr:hypothetical protein [Lysinibacillus sp. G4S2]MDM5246639.1 hypothetical protein [Lysinibacillus sp. G4S2]
MCEHKSKFERIVYLYENEATATNVFCSKSEATATIMPMRNL